MSRATPARSSVTHGVDTLCAVRSAPLDHGFIPTGERLVLALGAAGADRADRGWSAAQAARATLRDLARSTHVHAGSGLLSGPAYDRFRPLTRRRAADDRATVGWRHGPWTPRSPRNLLTRCTSGWCPTRTSPRPAPTLLPAGVRRVRRRRLHPARGGHPRHLAYRPVLPDRADVRRARQRRRRLGRGGPCSPRTRGCARAGSWSWPGCASVSRTPCRCRTSGGGRWRAAMERYCGRTDLDVMVFGDTHTEWCEEVRGVLVREPRFAHAAAQLRGTPRHHRLPRHRRRQGDRGTCGN